MNTPLELIAGFQEATAQLREQHEKMLPTLSLCGDDCRYMDVPYIIEALNDVKENLPADLSVIAARIVADLALLNEMTNDQNALIQERNDILLEQIGDLHTALEVQLADVPERQLNRAVTIGTKHLNDAELALLEAVYTGLKVTHVNHEERKDLVYYNYDERPTLREDIIAAFYAGVKENNLNSELEFRNYVHSEAVMGYTSDLVKVIESKL